MVVRVSYLRGKCRGISINPNVAIDECKVLHCAVHISEQTLAKANDGMATAVEMAFERMIIILTDALVQSASDTDVGTQLEIQTLEAASVIDSFLQLVKVSLGINYVCRAFCLAVSCIGSGKAATDYRYGIIVICVAILFYYTPFANTEERPIIGEISQVIMANDA